ncbi:MAG: undecaprenyl-diphosphate phosphatase [Bacteroidales bacterium]|nr:undecaprenyl-diphosphate phosphatase [Bacteroidales bacterium]
MNFLQSIIIAIVEGITEFLPISSTGHMIIVQKLLGIRNSDFTNLYIVNIQFGAILSVVVLYWKKFIEPLRKNKTEGNFLKRFQYKYDFYLKLLAAFLPAAFFGLLFRDQIYKMLESVVVVAISLVAGGIVLVFVDDWFGKETEDRKITYPKAFKIGFFQVIAMIPGMSRSAATIIGGLTQKLTRKRAAEFSFFLAVPTMLAASALEVFSNFHSLGANHVTLLVAGNIVAFIVALLAIKGFISYLTRHGFRVFGYYRIFVGLLIIILLLMGVDLQIAGG